MSKINVLPKEVFNLISAGEVVERPASVVKELFENAIDSGADDITISIEGGGLQEIHVQDNGCGIEKDDLKKAFLPHATSKIAKAADLDYIQTLGFRGEALASIAAVSETQIVSKIEDDFAYQITCEGGKVGQVYETVAIEGTSVTVKNLFYNTPVRLKFLKSVRSEEREVSALVDKLMLSNPDIAIRYFVDGNLVKQTYGDGLKDVVMTVYGKEAVDNSYEIRTDKNGLYIYGYIGNTNYVKANRTYQTLIVNGRCVTDATITSAMQNAYANYLMKRQYPVYVLNITIDPSLVDVNVHPRKSEVRFANNQIVYGSVYSVVSKVLDGSSQALNIVSSAPFIFNEQNITKADSNENNSDQILEQEGKKADEIQLENPVGESKYGFTYDLSIAKKRSANVQEDPLRTVVDFSDDSNRIPQQTEKANDIFYENKMYIQKLEQERKQVQVQLDVDQPIRYIGQALGTYVIQECGDELIIIDQHAAHERILFDSYYESIKLRKVATQKLLCPYVFSTNNDELMIMYDMMPLFKETGFDLQVCNENCFEVKEVPVELSDVNLDQFFRDILTDSRFKNEKIPSVIREAIAQKACKAAIKAGDKISLEEVNSLMERLKQNWGLKCPHGRPIAIKISRTEIDKWFKRIV